MASIPGSMPADAPLDGLREVEFLSDGRMIALSSHRESPPVVLDPHGSFLRTIGKAGKGPGEFQNVNLVRVLRGDSVVFFDASLRRIATFSPSLAYLGSVPLPAAPQAVVRTPSGRWVFNAAIRSPERAGYPIHLVSATGEVEGSFGTSRPQLAMTDPTINLRQLIVLPGGDLLVLHVTRAYRIERWTAGGVFRGAWDREPSWFRPYASLVLPTPSQPPRPYVAGGWIDDEGRLWVACRVPAPRWAEGLAPPMKGEGGDAMYQIADPQRLYSTRLEVIDLARGEVIASQAFSGNLQLFVQNRPGIAGRNVQLENGEIRTDLVRFRLQPGPHQ